MARCVAFLGLWLGVFGFRVSGLRLRGMYEGAVTCNRYPDKGTHKKFEMVRILTRTEFSTGQNIAYVCITSNSKVNKNNKNNNSSTHTSKTKTSDNHKSQIIINNHKVIMRLTRPVTFTNAYRKEL